MAGYSACGLLLGSYMIEHGGASDSDLGTIYMIAPMIALTRPLISAQADRYQSHKKLLVTCLLCTSLAYLPFVVIPLVMEYQPVAQILTERIRFWLLVLAHFVGSVGFCGVRALGDSLAVNYAKRIGEDFATYRKYGSISFGIFGYLLGQINQDWILPEFVPSMCLYVLSMALLTAIVYFWHDEFYVMKAQISNQQVDEEPEKLPSKGQVAAHMKTKLGNLLTFSSTRGSKAVDVECKAKSKFNLSARQQASIFLLLLRRDIRIPMFLGLLFYSGCFGHAPQNFVYTFIIRTCDERGTCDGPSLTGILMISYCICETTCYMVLNAFRGRLNHMITMLITLTSLTIHYYFYGLFIDHVSPYFFFFECLHGLEFATSIVASVELGYMFGNEVELILPELIERGVISKDDDPEIIKICLLSVLSSCFTLVYDGLGTFCGAILYGLVIEYSGSFNNCWLLIGTMGLVGFFVVLLVYFVGKCLHIEPQIFRLERARKSSVGKAEL